MKIKISDVEKKGYIHLSYSEEPTLLNLDKGRFRPTSPLKVDVHLNKTRDGVYASGKVEATLSLNCSRCLKHFPYPVSEEFHFEYRPRQTEFPEEIELDEEAVGIVFFEGDEIELSDQVRQDVLLAIPMKPVCGESCKGLCQVCGGDLNVVECDCSPAAAWSPFAKLKDMKLG